MSSDVGGSSAPRCLWPRITGAALALMYVSSAHADPCKAIPDRGPLPAYLVRGARFEGPVTYVGDGDSLCVAVGNGSLNWVEVRLADFYAPELHASGGQAAKATLAEIAMGRHAVCVVGHRSYDRVVAQCLIDGVSIGDRMRTAGIGEGGNGR
jgi:micrococcal nuclease